MASPPIVNLLVVRRFMPRSFMMSRMTSLEETPICRPKLPPSIRIAAGGPHPLLEPWRHRPKPFPYFAPKTNAPFLSPGPKTMQ